MVVESVARSIETNKRSGQLKILHLGFAPFGPTANLWPGCKSSTTTLSPSTVQMDTAGEADAFLATLQADLAPPQVSHKTG